MIADAGIPVNSMDVIRLSPSKTRLNIVSTTNQKLNNTFFLTLMFHSFICEARNNTPAKKSNTNNPKLR